MALTNTEIPNEILRAFQAGVDDILHDDDAVRRRLQAAEVVGVRTFTLGLTKFSVPRNRITSYLRGGASWLPIQPVSSSPRMSRKAETKRASSAYPQIRQVAT